LIGIKTPSTAPGQDGAVARAARRGSRILSSSLSDRENVINAMRDVDHRNRAAPANAAPPRAYSAVQQTP